MRVSVVIPCFNYGRYLAEAVQSVLAQSLRDVEVIVVDDGSTDDSRDVAESLIAAHADASIRLIAQTNSGSPGHTRNVGIAAAVGDYIVCLDADDRLHPDYLARCAAALDAHPDAAIAYGDLQMFGDDDTLHVPPEWDTRVQLDCNFVDVVSMFRRRVWREVGGYDTEIGYEDWDFWIGAIELGWTGVKAPGALWYYRKHGSGVFAQHTVRDQEIKAEIVLKHPGLYNDRQREWAAGILAGDPRALADGTQQGAIPPFRAVARGAAAAPRPPTSPSAASASSPRTIRPRSPAASRGRCRCRPTGSRRRASRSMSSPGAVGRRGGAQRRGCRRARGPGAEHRRPRRAALPRDPDLELRGRRQVR